MKSIIKIPNEGPTQYMRNLQAVLFDEVSSNIDNPDISDSKMKYFNEYLFHICFKISGSLLAQVIKRKGFNEKSKEYKDIIKCLCRYSLEFANTFQRNKLIDDYSYSNISNDNIIFISSIATLEKYNTDMEYYIRTGELFYNEEEVEDDGIYFRRIDYSFIRDLFKKQIEESNLGIIISYPGHFIEDDDFDLKVNNICKCISTLLLMSKL